MFFSKEAVSVAQPASALAPLRFTGSIVYIVRLPLLIIDVTEQLREQLYGAAILLRSPFPECSAEGFPF